MIENTRAGDTEEEDEADLGPLAEATPAWALELEQSPPGEHFRRDHFAPPDWEGAPADWPIEVCGLVGRPRTLRVGELEALAAREERVVLECAGHRRREYVPMPAGLPWGVGAVGEACWTGVRLADVLALAGGARSDATKVVLEGADRGEVPGGRGVEPFARALPLAKALDGRTILATTCGSEPIGLRRGGPVRAIVPGWYATDSVKWLRRIELIDGDFHGWFDAYDYRFRPPGETGRGQRMSELPVNSLLLRPEAGAALEAGSAELRGIAWGGEGGPSEVWVQVGQGDWRAAHLDAKHGAFARGFWSLRVELEPGEYAVAVRAIDSGGAGQPDVPPPNLDGYGNNSVQRVRVSVRAGAAPR